MLPLYFGAPVRPLFGAYHPSKGAHPRGVGVVLCGPFGHEELHAHRAQRHLAERLARAGFAALRFDYDGTGDSGGDDREGGRVAAWRESILLAVSALRERAGVSTVVLVGLRAGALLALYAARAAGADRLVLWNPVPSGRAHARELVRVHKVLFREQTMGLRAAQARPAPQTPRPKTDSPRSDRSAGEHDEALGYVLRKDTVADLGKLDALTLSEKPASACLVIGGNDNPTEDKLLDSLRALGVEVEYKHLPGHPFLVTDPHRSEVPSEVLGTITSYLSSHYATETESRSASTPPLAKSTPPPAKSTPPPAKSTPPPAKSTPPPAMAVTGGPASEQAWTIGEGRTRFGVLTPPRKAEGKPAIILMNAGTIHRVGPNRSFVRMARRWADLGYPVLRMDLSGIGDSPVAEGSEENLPYPRHAVTDAQAAMTALAERGVARTFILSGLCSGADIAFRTGVLDTRVVGSWMINPQAFYFPSSDSLKEFMHAELNAQYYQSGLWDLERWKRLLGGQVDLRRVAGVMRAKLKSSLARRVARLFGGRLDTEKSPEARDVIADLRSMASRGADTFLLCSEDDPGLIYLLKYFGEELATLDGLKNYRREVVKGTDHTFTPLASQDMLSDMLTEHLLKRHPR